VALEIDSPTGPLIVETLEAGDIVGWSWIFPPYRWVYDVHIVERARLVVIDAGCLRKKCDADPEFGYRVMKRFAQVVAQRLAATRLRLLDLYGNSVAS
jgi:CRP-like cAMP-binding protein